MRISEVMSEPVETVPPSMPLDQAAGLMRTLRVHHLVVKEGSKLTGLLSSSDLPRPGTVHDGGVVRDVMSVHVATIDEKETVRRAANLMRGRSIGCLVATRNGKLAGIVTVSDLLDLLGKGGERRVANPRASLHYRVPHQKQHRGRSW
ncbi:MAG TPA: CBS domain-containing protein [Vicinamibacterales bacterium]|nr:CBS domain-containing protein [Vicinamibacterales bacterium]